MILISEWYAFVLNIQRGVTPSTYMWERHDDYLHEVRDHTCVYVLIILVVFVQWP